jgi:sulfopyruvate decarboxylase alpha subunit
MPETNAVPDWYHKVYAHLRSAGVELVCSVPDAGLDPLLRSAQADPAVRTVMLTTEEEGVAICCGSWLGGKKGVLLIQSSGVGNCINAFTLIRNCRFPFLVIISMRGEYGEGMPWQIPMGRATPGCLEELGFTVHRAERADEVAPMVEAALKMAWRSDQAVAILLAQRLIGVKDI